MISSFFIKGDSEGVYIVNQLPTSDKTLSFVVCEVGEVRGVWLLLFLSGSTITKYDEDSKMYSKDIVNCAYHLRCNIIQ